MTALVRELKFSGNAKLSRWIWHGQIAGTYVVNFHSEEVDIEPGLMNFLYKKFLDEPAFNAAVNKSTPSKDHRLDLEKQRDKAAKELAKTEKTIGNLVDAIANGADISLLLNKQLDLKDERDALAERLDSLEREVVSLPDPKMTKQSAAIARIHLMERLKPRDWKKLPYNEVREFLIYLFGEASLSLLLATALRNESFHCMCSPLCEMT